MRTKNRHDHHPLKLDLAVSSNHLEVFPVGGDEACTVRPRSPAAKNSLSSPAVPENNLYIAFKYSIIADHSASVGSQPIISSKWSIEELMPAF